MSSDIYTIRKLYTSRSSQEAKAGLERQIRIPWSNDRSVRDFEVGVGRNHR